MRRAEGTFIGNAAPKGQKLLAQGNALGLALYE